MGSGYTVEGQKTGEEKHGGLQIEIIPAFRSDVRIWLRDSDVHDDFTTFFEFTHILRKIDELSTPRQLGFDPGTKLRVYPVPAFRSLPCSLSDIGHDKDGPVQLLVGPCIDNRKVLYGDKVL